MRQRKISLLIALCTVITMAAFCGSTTAITGNQQPDTSPYTCIIVLYGDTARTQPLSYSTGVLISPNIVLTAGHCVAGGAAASVCFDPNPKVTIDQNGISYSTDQPIYNGVPVAYPSYIASLLAEVKPSEVLQTSDVGLIILNTPVQEVENYPKLPEANFADSLPVSTNLQISGYGVQQLIKLGNERIWVGDFSRNTATVQLLSGNFQGSDKYIKCSANSAQGKGGIAYGDSGGPVIYSQNGEEIVLAINAYVNNANCAGVTFHTRIDNPQVLGWISGYL